MMLTKLSVDLLYNAIVRVQCTESNCFAIIANKEVIDILRAFSTALKLPSSSHNILWGMPFVEDDSLDNKSVYFACKLEGMANPSDYMSALKFVVGYVPDEKYEYADKLTNENVWSLRVLLV